jgi:hypothetical protein
MAQFESAWLGNVPEPREVLDDGTYRDGLGRFEQRRQSELADVWYWMNRFSESLPRLDEYLQGIRSVTRIAAGFIEELEGAFGVIIYTDSPRSDQTREESDQPPERSQYADQPPRYPTSITVDGLEFPVIVRQSVAEQHWCTAPEVTAPMVARATCWVRSSIRGYEGWLMPRHAVNPLNSVVTYSDGTSGRLLDHFGECIDSVVVSGTNLYGGSPTPSCWPVVAGQKLEVTHQPGGHRPLTVIDSDLNLGVLRSVVFPVRFSTDWLGVAGNSGSLIVEPSRGEPAGSYLGVLRPSIPGYVPPGMTGLPPSTGYAQSCHQLERAAGLGFVL